ncbi:MAG: DUF924 domain-containing protein [Rhodospirillales bacterium]|jgi:uncharacterized protein (DUF924 family)|nr:DUF924 domain-containing protein [Rhodospirillales bacterium]MBT4626419.1 DUF924 domain-containing protein [Rhodospirillales bacterium]MBT5350898.1 DUF924 domain-containing protein [Rhodospirillales bacterium]MBT5520663.1 DUF924 domain-containing protein [Rhodospirillales bacterium]MBT6109074.1 DUF924 domain-containing protein [Rhodospirillales bacterium]
MSISLQERGIIDAMMAVWFGARDSAEFGEQRKEWWGAFEDFDAAIRETLLPHVGSAARGDLDHWISDVDGGLVLIILLDQVPRNMFRGTAQAFATDTKAVEVARQYLDLGFDQLLLAAQRTFAYLPFEHSENIADQDYSVALFTELGDASNLDFAVRHQEVVERFGRFPHRNEFLGRTSTPEELQFLTQPNSSF